MSSMQRFESYLNDGKTSGRGQYYSHLKPESPPLVDVSCRRYIKHDCSLVGRVMDACWEDAVRRGDTEIVRDLLERGVDANARDRYGQTGVMLAAHGGHLATVTLLIEHNADLNVTAKYGLSAVMLAVVAGHEEIALALARAGADLTLRGTGAPGFADKTAADLATERGCSQLAIALAPAQQKTT